jgi:tetratricopeptide (TPR) repeat protein
VTRWKDLNNKGVELLKGGDTVGAKAAFDAAYRETTVDTEARVSTLVNLSAVVDPDQALDLLAEAAGLASTLRATVLATRADILLRLGRWDEAWQDIERGLADASPHEQALLHNVKTGLLMVAGRLVEAKAEALATIELATAHMPDLAAHAHTNLARISEALGDKATSRAIRASALVAGGQFGAAADEARIALDLAYAEAPHLAASVHATLAEIAGSTGDLAGSAEHWGLARDLSAATGDNAVEATALLSLGRLAYLASDNDRASLLYDEASVLLRANGDRRGLAVCLHGRAAVEVSRGRPRDALMLLDDVLDTLTAPLERVATYQVQGGALEALGEFAQADERYGLAMTVSEQAGLWHVALGIAWWRADALVRWASTVSGEPRHELSRRALDLALPAALAAEAVRHRFDHGPLRERWAALAAAPATRAAFEAIAAVGDVELAAAYIDHIAATVSLQQAMPIARDELLSLPEPPGVEETSLPYAAVCPETGGWSCRRLIAGRARRRLPV